MILLDPDLEPDPPPIEQPRGTHRSASNGASFSRRPAPFKPKKPPQHVPSPRSFARFLTQAQAAVRLRGRVSVLLTTDKTLRRLNRQFRGIDKPTDVLSFPAEALIQNKDKIAGDLAVSVPTAYRQSVEQGHSLAIEIKVLILHGLLHLAGYDHETDSGQMARRERRLRAQLRLPQGLIERTESTPATKMGAPSMPRLHRGKGGIAPTPVRRTGRTAGAQLRRKA